MKPRTKYTKSGNFNIAYQVIGQGSIDLLYIPGWVSNIDMMWAEPRLAAFLTRLTQFARLIIFDKRGTGLSDRSDAYSTMAERMDDINAVLDAVGSTRTFLFSHSEGGSVSLLYSLKYPHRTQGVIGFGIFAKRRYAIDYPWAPTPAERELSNQRIEDNWPHGSLDELKLLVPSLAHDRVFMDWLTSYLRCGASPRAALILQRENTNIDITIILDSITVPTLLLFRKGDTAILVEEGRYLADRIPGAKLLELSGRDHLFWTGETDRTLLEMEAFVTGMRPRKAAVERAAIDIAQVMHDNFLRNLRVEELAKLCGRSLSAFKRDFRKRFKTTPSRWIRDKRLEHARLLLHDPEVNINQVCYACGYLNPSHFIRAFKKKYHAPPHRYRTALVGAYEP